MRYIFLYVIFSSILLSCSSKKQIIYIQNSDHNKLNKIADSTTDNIEIGDILKIDVYTSIPEASIPYNYQNNNFNTKSIDQIILDGYVVNENSSIIFPVLGEINVLGSSEIKLSEKITKLLVDGGHLSNPFVKVKRVNSKFTVLGEVNSPGTFNFYDSKLNIFQAIGKAGDLLITAKKKYVVLIREENGLRKVFKISLNDSELLNTPQYFIKNNDVIIVEPNYSKIKSAGFIGSPSSIASISSILLSITLLLINN